MSSLNDKSIWWPATASSEPPTGVIVVSTNYNTKELIAHLLWSLYHFLGDELHSVLIVDNGSTDGSVEVLQAVAGAGLCELIINQENRQHGPALSQAITHLAQAQQGQSAAHPWLWLLDSDCLIARCDAATRAIMAAREARAAVVGESYWNRWHNTHRFAGYSFLLDPAQVWQPTIGVIPDGGDPIGDFGQACHAHGTPMLSFPFTQEGYLIHRGRSTLATVRQRGESANPLYEWARDHHEPHFQEVAGARERYAALIDEFNQQVGDDSADALIRACRAAR